MSLLKKRFVIPVILLIGLYFFYEANFEVPILMYHHVGTRSDLGSVSVSTQTFSRQMEFLKAHDYHVISLKELADILKSGQKIPPKTVVITFDDGNLDIFTYAFPVLKNMSFPATIFMITNNINKEGSLSAEDLRILDSSGVSIGSHTVSHAFLPDLKKEEIEYQLRESKKTLEKILGHEAYLFSYPAGGVTREAQALVEAEGYQAAVTTNYGRNKHVPTALHRIKISESRGSLFSFWIKVSGLYHFGKRRIEIQ